MDTHFAVLPLDVIDTVVSQLPDEIPYFLRLPHPRTGIPSLFLAHETGHNEDGPDRKRLSKILEVQAVEPPNARSWFMGDQVISDGKLLIMTPIDPLFLLIPILGAIKQPDGDTEIFRPADDMFEDAARYLAEASMRQDASLSVRVEDVTKFGALGCTTKAMKRLCDVKEVTPEITVFRYSAEKLLQELMNKVTSLSTPRTTELSRCMVRSLAKDGLMEDKHEDLLELGRTKLACEILGQYLPHDIQQILLASYDWARLDTHVRSLAKEQALSTSKGDAVTKKSRSDLAIVPEGTKKRKNDKVSQGVDKLKRANVRGMSKLSTYFTKKAE